jgi:TrmH family RNA methyltransferase
MLASLDRIRIVLVRPKIAGNIGATARAMANMGLSDLALVNPRVSPDDERARQRSAAAEWLLKSARVTNDLADALADVHWTVGTSCRGGMYRQAIETDPRAMAAQAASRTANGQRVAILFGTEDNGLDRTEVLACDAVVRIPSHESYKSLNLAHSVMVCAYELFLAAASGQADQVGRHDDQADGDLADSAMMIRLMDKLGEALLELGYLRPEHPEHLLSALRSILGRAGLTVGEAQIIMGLAQQIQEFARYGPQRR